MSDNDDSNSPLDKELEDELRKLIPSKINPDLIAKLSRDHARITAFPEAGPLRSKWLLFTLTSCALVFCGTTFLKVRHGLQERGTRQEVAEQQAESQPKQQSPNRDEFLPVSSEGRLIKASSGGIFKSETGPTERYELDYEDIHHWHNPDTATDIRIFTPRREVIMIPVQTD